MRLTLPAIVLAVAAAAPLAAQIDEVATPRGARAASAATACTLVPDPPLMSARGTTLRMAPANVTIGALSLRTNVYNGRFVAPTLTLAPGERFDLNVVNAMAATDSQTASDVAWTNNHYHGLVVTPNPNGGDNVTHVRIENDGRPRHYDFLVPSYHTQGMFWYHPHPHGITNPQVAGGLSGALLVGSILTYFPQYRGVRERTLLIRDLSFSIPNSYLNVNGSPCARLPLRPGEPQLLHIGNFGSNTFVNLKMSRAHGGTVPWTLLALDGNPLLQATQVDSIYLPPGSRAEVIVWGPQARDSVQIYSAPFAPKTTAAPVTLGWLVPSGTAWRDTVRTLAGVDKSVADTLAFLRNATDVRRQTFRFRFIGDSAGINDSIYAPHHNPVSVPWGQVQEWTLVNETTALHTFHIHQTDFEVVSVNGRPANEGRLRDNIPPGRAPRRPRRLGGRHGGGALRIRAHRGGPLRLSLPRPPARGRGDDAQRLRLRPARSAGATEVQPDVQLGACARALSAPGPPSSERKPAGPAPAGFRRLRGGLGRWMAGNRWVVLPLSSPARPDGVRTEPSDPPMADSGSRSSSGTQRRGDPPFPDTKRTARGVAPGRRGWFLPRDPRPHARVRAMTDSHVLPCGHTVRDPAQTHYCTYLRLPELLSLQPGPDQARHPDEHLFVATHQSFEIWFSQLRTDLPRIIALLDADDLAGATWLVQRCTAVVRMFSPMMRMLETMTLGGFYAFRHHLVPASGGESGQWHEIEILSGAREPEFRRYLEAEVHPDPSSVPHSRLWTPRLEALWDQPSVAAAAQAAFARREVTPADAYESAHFHGGKGDLVALAEALLDYDEEVRVWRFVHARTAERTLGPDIPGTANTSGVRYLERMASHRSSFFPFLWGARGELWNRMQGGGKGEDERLAGNE